MRTALLVIQVGTFLGLGALLLTQGHIKLGLSQLLLATVQGLLYS